MKQQPDKLFRDKLEAFSKAAPSTAWDRVEASLDKNRYPYWRMAAAALILFFIGAGYFFWPATNPTSPIAAKKDGPARVEKTEEVTRVPEEETEAENREQQSGKDSFKEEKNTNDQNRTFEKNNRTIPKAHPAQDEPREIEAAPENDVTPEVHLAQNNVDETNKEAIALISGTEETNTTTPRSGTTIILTVADTNEYFKKNNNTDATPEEKKSSRLKRMLKKATDLKSNQDPVGDIRQLKNEILALNFISEKQRSQNN